MTEQKKGLVPFNPNSLKVSGGNGVLANLGKPAGATSNAAMQMLNAKPAKPIQIIYGLDYTQSTVDVIEEFKRQVEAIYVNIARKHPQATQYFGLFNDAGKIISAANQSDFYKGKSNKAGDNNLCGFIANVVDQRAQADTENIIIIFADGVDDAHAASTAVKKMQTVNAHFFFVYQDTRGGGKDSTWIKHNLIDPMGDKAVMLSISEVGEIIKLVDSMVAYVASQTTQGASQRSFADYLKILGGGASTHLSITQGTTKQLGSGS